jgi:hypothetical protein
MDLFLQAKKNQGKPIIKPSIFKPSINKRKDFTKDFTKETETLPKKVADSTEEVLVAKEVPPIKLSDEDWRTNPINYDHGTIGDVSYDDAKGEGEGDSDSDGEDNSYNSDFEGSDSEGSDSEGSDSEGSEFMFDKNGTTFYKKDNRDCSIQYSFSPDGKTLTINQFICENDVKNMGKKLLYNLINKLKEKGKDFDYVELTPTNYDPQRQPKKKDLEEGDIDESGNLTDKYHKKIIKKIEKNYLKMGFTRVNKDSFIGETNEILLALALFLGGSKKTKRKTKRRQHKKSKKTKKRRHKKTKRKTKLKKRKTKRRTQRKRK